jgi:DNA (cytosine-5)-methyltransferase 1
MSLKAIDFFCGAGGMTYGMRQAGIDVIAGIDIDESCKETYEYNNPTSKFIKADIKNFTFQNLIQNTRIRRNDNNLLFIGCSPCQYWSVIRTIRTKSVETKNLLSDFQNFVDYFRPGYIVIENVPGILSHKEESGLNVFINFLVDAKYNVTFDKVNVNDYGVPQTRKRFILIASRMKEVKLPIKKKGNKAIVKDFLGKRNGFPSVSAGYKDESDFMHTVAGLEKINIERLSKTKKNGGTREAWEKDDRLQLETYKLHVGFKDVYGRMSWDKPGPTITTKFFSISNGRFGHPDELRAISLREGATLQTFPKKYVFKGKSIATNAKLIGNAVPPFLSRKIAEAILS